MLHAPLLKEQLADGSMSGAKSSLHQMEDSLRHNRPLQALQAHLSDAELTDGGSFKAGLSAEQHENIAARARHLAVCSSDQPQVCISVQGVKCSPVSLAAGRIPMKSASSHADYCSVRDSDCTLQPISMALMH